MNKQFVFIANELLIRFPDLDLRFNLSHGTNAIRYKAAAVSAAMFEIPMSEKDPEEVLYEAIFNIKQIANLYDA